MIKNYAIIQNGVVVNIAVSEFPLDINWIQSDVAQIGWTYDGTEFHAPPLPPESELSKIITKLAFRFRMTDAEYVGILSAAKTDVEVAAWVETFNMVSLINLTDPRTKDGLDMMVSKNLLTAQRRDQILNDLVRPDEQL